MRRKITPGVDFEWRSDSLVFNLFRVWELLFGAPVGIRKTASVIQYEKDGRIVVERAFYTWEALLSYWEVTAKAFFRTLKLPRFEFVPVVQLKAATPFGPALVPVYSFAIARDVNSTSADATGTTTRTWPAINVTGSNPAVFLGFTAASSDTATTGAFNSVSATQVEKNQNGASRWSYLYYLAGTSGNASFTVDFSSSPDFCNGVESAYSGVASGAVDSSAQADATATTSITVTTTVVASNCWLAGWIYAAAVGGPIAAGSGTSAVATNSDNLGFFDSNATVGTGSQSLIANNMTGNWAGMIASFAPAVAAGPANVKTWDGLAQSTGVKTYMGNTLANTKTVDGLA